MEDEEQADGRDERVDRRTAGERSHRQALDQRAEAHAQRQRRKHREPERQVKGGERGERRERADHSHLALGEVHHVGRLVDDDEREREERVDAAEREAGDDELQRDSH